MTQAARPSLARAAILLATGVMLAGTGAATAQTVPPPALRQPNYVPPIPGQNLSPPAPRQNMVPTPPPPTRPGEGDSSQRIQGGSTRRLPLPQTGQ
ncbi:hypothetical protein GCM10007301_25870 [Azorhizobium oxalatiphilum]|uniref:Uncharacterized protein n=1 Tax=Azorhizobium oxalatiphilum TaxID=980631 RepID=A0A917BZG7_9HYPH|nr:hypothetical protein [Azorhizobium oxalatiphilum]GGF64917.1 hypothetical protein GCM10007301_25870 [Azorhizobium oxalatiphilum]